MWLVIKLKKGLIFEIFKSGLKKILSSDPKIYSPKITKQSIKGNKFYQKDLYVLGNYVFVFHEKFRNNFFINKLSFIKGVDTVLKGFHQSQDEINLFIDKCKKNEDENGYLLQEFFSNVIGEKIKFHSGPFINFVSELIDVQRNKISLLAGKYKILVSKKTKNIIYC
tara:strand:- start:1766 stop:2266 length:501 start_codon:yes stop_codon:yes gene_type:complete